MKKSLLCVFTLLMLSACAQEKTGAPMPEKKVHKHELHGDVRVDDYFWLRERENPEVISYLEAENAYSDTQMQPMKGIQQILFDEMKSRIKEDDDSAPYKYGDYYYFRRFVTGNEYPIYVRKKGSLEAPDEVLLDVNKLAGDVDYFALRGFKVSPDHKMAAYGVDTKGRRFYDLYFLNLETGETSSEVIEDTTANFVWANDSQTILYGRQHPETLRSYRVYRHEIDGDADALVFEEKDETNYLGVSKSLAGKFIFLTSSQTLSNEVRYISAESPTDDPTVFLPREENHEYFVVDGGDRFFIVSNEGATNFRLLEAPLDNTAKGAWQEVVAHRDNALIEDYEVFQDYIAVHLVEDGLSQIEIIDRASGVSLRVDFDEDVYTASSGSNAEFTATTYRYVYESLTTPESIYDFDMSTNEHDLIKEKAVLGGFDRDNYESQRIFVSARDGAQVPVSLVYKKGMQRNGKNPTLQYGYGSYGSIIEPSFGSAKLSLLDRGFIYAISHIRGGAEMGREWYYDGRQLNKKNTFSDFIDVSKYMIEEGYTSPDHLYARGGSAGGLLMGAVVNMAPELYRGVSTRVPFVDVVTTMLDEDIPLTAGEWDEWGNPAEKEYYDYMKSYSPYDNIQAQSYPNLLVTTGLHDSQVQYWEPAKWVAKLREYKTDENLLLLKTDMAAGHSGKTGRFKKIEDTALYYGFFLYLEGIRE